MKSNIGKLKMTALCLFASAIGLLWFVFALERVDEHDGSGKPPDSPSCLGRDGNVSVIVSGAAPVGVTIFYPYKIEQQTLGTEINVLVFLKPYFDSNRKKHQYYGTIVHLNSSIQTVTYGRDRVVIWDRSRDTDPAPCSANPLKDEMDSLRELTKGTDIIYPTNP